MTVYRVEKDQETYLDSALIELRGKLTPMSVGKFATQRHV
jgi:hypothetical protein